jgi:hypothetical protein
MTKAQLITDLQNMIGPGIEVDPAGLTTWLNDAYMQMVDAITEVNPDYFTKSATADTVANQQEYDLPSDFERVTMVTVTLAGVTYRFRPLPNITDVPIHGQTDANNGYALPDGRYYIVGDNIGLLPIPDEAGDENLKLWYVYTPAELSADTDEPVIPKKYHHLIKYGAYANYLDQDDEHVAAENMRRRFDARVEQMISVMSQNQVDEPKSVQITNTDGLYVDELGDW